jgi:putative spermidine/putrescine transport system substrate-binding protein
MKRSSLFVALALSSAFVLAASAEELTIVSFGGADQAAQAKAFYEPWEQAGNGKIIRGVYNGEIGKVRAMVDTKSVSWDLVEVEMPELSRGCDEGMFEELDPAMFGDPDKFIPGALHPCGAGFYIWSTVLAYDASKLKTPPTSWVDFWDTHKFPGKRALRKGAKYTLEIALMADGVAPQDVYKLLKTREGQDRAFRKLDELKPYIQWWEAGAQPPQYLASGDVVMSSAYNGRIASVQQTSALKVVWNGGIYDFDAWAIPKGSKNVDAAKRFISLSMKPEHQKTFAENIPYGPSHKDAIALLSPALLEQMPTNPENMANQTRLDVQFWTDFGESLEQRFIAWSAK